MIKFGTVLKQGELPSGQTPKVDSLTSSGVVLNRWPDNSAKYVVVFTEASNGSYNVVNEIPSGTVLGIADLPSAWDVVTTITAGGTHISSAKTLLQGTPTLLWQSEHCSAWTVGGVIGTHSDLHVYYHVYLYSDGFVETDVIVEYGWPLDTTPSLSISYSIDISQSGSTVYSSGSMTHGIYSRWRHKTWYPTTQAGIGIPDTRDIMDTKALPNFATFTPTASSVTPYTPLGNGDLLLDWGATGADQQIGPLPEWVVRLLLLEDADGYNTTMANSGHAGSCGVFYRDKSTTNFLRLIDHPNSYSIVGGDFHGDPGQGVTNGINWDTAHHGDFSSVAYILTGEQFHYETMMSWALAPVWAREATTGSNPRANNFQDNLGSDGCVYGQNRSVAWWLRNAGIASFLAKGGDTIFGDEVIRILNENIQYYEGRYISPGADAQAMGGMKPLSSAGPRPWQDDWFTWAWCRLYQLGFDGTNGKLSALPMARYKSQFAVQRIYDFDTCPWFAVAYDTLYGNSWAEWTTTRQAELLAKHPPGIPLSTYPCGTQAFMDQINAIGESGSPYQLGDIRSNNDANSYFGDLQMALSTCVDLNLPTGFEAQQAWLRFDQARYRPPYTGHPNRNVVPRTAPQSLPSWMPESMTVAEIPQGNTENSVKNANGHTKTSLTTYSGGAVAYIAGLPYMIFFGGGHADGSWNGILKFGPLTSDLPVWSQVIEASPFSEVLERVAYYADGKPTARHTYHTLAAIEDKLYCCGAPAVWRDPTTSFDSVDVADLTNGTWSGQGTYPDTPVTAQYSSGAIEVPERKAIYYYGASTNTTPGYKYDITQGSNGSWVSQGWNVTVDKNAGAAYDNKRGKLLICAISSSRTFLSFYIINLDTNTVEVSSAPDATNAPLSSMCPQTSPVYDEGLDAFVWLSTGGNPELLLLDAASLTWAVIPVTVESGTTVPDYSNDSDRRLYDKVRYIKELGGIFATDTTHSTFLFYRTSKNMINRSVGIGVEVTVPALSDFNSPQIILSPDAGQWDARFASAAPASMVKFGDTYFLYYVGADGDRADNGPANRALGVATAPRPEGPWTKYAGNPVIPYSAVQAYGRDEEGVWAATAYVDGSEVILFVSELRGNTSDVKGDIALWTSSDGLNFTDQGTVIARADLHGDDEKKVMGVHKEKDGTWNLYYNAKGSNLTNWSVYVASGPARNSFTTSSLVLERSVTGTQTWRGGGDISVIENNGSTVQYVMPVSIGNDGSNDVLLFTDEAAPTTAALARHYSETRHGMTVLYLDREKGVWYFFDGDALDSNTDDILNIRVRSTPAVEV